MNIKLLCPVCHEILTDQFSCEACQIVAGNKYPLSLECIKCDKFIDVKISSIIEAMYDTGE